MARPDAPDRSRHLDWDGCLNLRDLGGLPTGDGRATAWGAFVRGDTLCGLSDPIRGILAQVAERYGGVGSYLEEHGARRRDLERVRARISGAAGSA